MIDDISAYDYTEDTKTLGIQDWIHEQLDDIFGKFWEPVFVKWFEDNSGLSVEPFIRY